MANQPNKNSNPNTNTPKKPTLEELRIAAAKAQQTADELKVDAEKEGATDEQKGKYTEALNEVNLANQAVQAAENEQAAAQQQSQENAQVQARRAEQADAARLAEEQAAAREGEEDPEKDPQYVPVFRDEEGERIPRNSLLRLVTTNNQNLRSLDGALITPEPTCELNGFDVRNGDWYTVQFQAGLIRVDSVKKIRK